MPDLTGQTLGKYQLVERLGRGGMATVYRAYQPGMDRYVAVKVMNTDLSADPDFVLRFKREAQSVGSLRHPNIVQVIDFDVHDEEYYMVMEYIKGETLKAMLQRRGALPVNEALDITIKLADALAYAHDKGMIHRDIKPANILFAAPDQPILMDFGIARILGTTGLTQEGAFLGTPAYVSPEAGRGDPVDARADIYSLGIVLYEMLTGVVPFNADTPFAVIYKHLNEPLPMPREFNESLPEAAERVVLKALTKERDDRFQSALEFKEALIKAKEGVLIEMPTQHGRTGVGTKIVSGARAGDAVSGTTSVIQRPVPGGLVLIAGIIAVAAIAIVVIALAFGNKSAAPGTATPASSPIALLPTVVVPTSPPTVAATSAPSSATGASSTSTNAATAAVTSAPGGSRIDPKYAKLVADVRQGLIDGDTATPQGQVEAALKADPNAYEPQVLYALIIFARGDRDHSEDAKLKLDHAMQAAPDRPEGYLVLGEYWLLHYGDNDGTDETRHDALTRAVQAFTDSINRGLGDYANYWGRAWANNNLEVETSVVLADYEKAGSLNPPDPAFYIDRAQFYYKQGMLDKAQADYEKSMAMRPTLSLQGYLGAIYLKRGNPDTAFALYSGGIDRDRATDPDYIADGAYVAWADKKFDKAAEWAKFAVSLDPANAKATYVLALLAWEAKSYDEALKDLDKVMQSTSSYNYPYLNRDFDRGPLADHARIIAAQGNVDDAIKAYADAIKADTGWPRLYIERAGLYAQKGDKDSARQDLRSALDLASAEKNDALITEIRKALADLGT